MQFFGERGRAFFDVWTLVHLAFWFVVGAVVTQLGWPRSLCWIGVVVGAYAWEIVEWALDEYTSLKMTQEGWINRWVSDPLMALLGTLLGMLAIGI